MWKIQVVNSVFILSCRFCWGATWMCAWCYSPGQLCVSVHGNAGEVVPDDLVNVIQVHLVQFLWLLFDNDCNCWRAGILWDQARWVPSSLDWSCSSLTWAWAVGLNKWTLDSPTRSRRVGDRGGWGATVWVDRVETLRSRTVEMVGASLGMEQRQRGAMVWRYWMDKVCSGALRDVGHHWTRWCWTAWAVR